MRNPPDQSRKEKTGQRRLSNGFTKQSLVLLLVTVVAHAADDGFVSLFNGKDLTHWIAPEGNNGHWKKVVGVIDDNAECLVEV